MLWNICDAEGNYQKISTPGGWDIYVLQLFAAYIFLVLKIGLRIWSWKRYKQIENITLILMFPGVM